MSGNWVAASKLFIFFLIFICLGLTFTALVSIPELFGEISNYNNKDYFIEKIGKDVEFLHGAKGGGVNSASVKIDGEEYVFRRENIEDFYINDSS